MTYYSRKSPRMKQYDYATSNYYFVTVCTHNRHCIFGLPDNLNRMGKIAEEHINQIPTHYSSVKIDKYVVMPNHVHLIVILENSDNNLNQIIAQFKSGVTRKIRMENPEISIWQRSYHDHVIRSQKEYETIWSYIDANPINWNKDCFYMDSAY